MERLPEKKDPVLRLLPAAFVLFAVVVLTGQMPLYAQSPAEPSTEASILTDDEPLPGADDDTPGDYELRTGMNEFGVFVGGGPSTALFTGLQPFESKNRSLLQAGFRYGRTLHVTKVGALQYMVEVTPLNLAFGNIIESDPGTATVIREKTSYGFGVAPIGIRYVLRPQKKVKIFGALNLGMMAFNDQMPVPDSKKLNFTSEADAGVMIWSRESKAVTLGFKFNHISNAGTGDLNPGINTAVFYVGYSVFK